ncbi:sulfatase family protein [Humisphaera borealis]|uniref:Sulfatase n=1 Tax=Humisphaera borealis TaxID=2807512 RepID=A0A7M2WRM1_9BACT|nr:sulfatase [Humisphaera borealis]QOV87802.1 sulfatase [Humisphaera borealis]
MNHRTPLLLLLTLLAANGVTAAAADPAGLRRIERPNVVLIFVDDMGYGDIGCFGAKDIKTPHIDRLATEGTKFTSFYVGQAVCTASRAALMTGCYPNRVGMQGALNHTSKTGIHPDELLLPEIFKQKGYATAIYGKWHLGTVDAFGPLKNGFDDFFGLPYSNDNGKKHPTIPNIPDLPLKDGEKVVELEPDQSQFTRQFTEKAVGFIDRNKSGPFFLYVPHVMPHVPIFASASFKGTSGRGLYGDVIQELDWSVGQIMAALRRHGLDDKTLVIFTSDNGPFISYGDHAGSNGPLREGKLTAYEGGMRLPCIMRWPGQVPAGRTSAEMLATIDLVPTVAKLLGVDLPKGRVIDGKDAWPLISGQPGAKSPHEVYYFYAGGELHAVRAGRWKLHVSHPYLTVAAEPGTGGKPSNWGKQAPKPITQSGIEGIASRHGYRVASQELALYDLEADVGESTNLAAANSAVVEQLMKYVFEARKDLGDELTGQIGSGVRKAGTVE